MFSCNIKIFLSRSRHVLFTSREAAIDGSILSVVIRDDKETIFDNLCVFGEAMSCFSVISICEYINSIYVIHIKHICV